MRTINEHKKMIAALALLLVGGFVWTLTAGDLNPTEGPTGTMRTLNEIYAAAFEPVVVPVADPGFSSMYLFLTGIPGEVNDANHADWIDLVGYTLHVENGADPKASPFPKFSNLLIAKETDLASVPLMLKACNNTAIAQVILERTTSTVDLRASGFLPVDADQRTSNVYRSHLCTDPAERGGLLRQLRYDEVGISPPRS